MLDKLSLRAFQAHEATDLEFSPRVNIITGNSNSGKTSIVRALNLIINNRPFGEGFINDNSDVTSGILGFNRNDNYFQITREKDRKSSGFYKIDFPEAFQKDAQKFTAFGTSVPEEISSLLNLSDINIQQQLSPYFLVLDSPGQIALYIREVARLDEIDEVVSLLASEVRDCSKKKSSLEEELLKIKKKLEELAVIDLDRLEKNINKFKVVEQEKEKISCQREEIENIVNQLRQLDLDMIYLPDDVGEKIDDLEDILVEYSCLFAEISFLEGLVIPLREAEEKKISLPKDVKNKISCIEDLVTKYNNKEQELICLSEVIESLEEYEIQLSGLDEESNQIEKERKDVLSQLKDCPYCGQELSTEAQEVLVGG